MGAPKNNHNGNKEITADSYIHIRVKRSDKANWVREANKNKCRYGGKLAPWVIETLNAEINKKEIKKMRVIKSIHMQGHELLDVTLGDEVSAKKITENNESYYEVYIGDECQDDYLMTNNINEHLVSYALSEDPIVSEGGGYFWGKKMHQLPEDIQQNILKKAGVNND